MPRITCPVCLKPFSATVAHQKTCSAECRRQRLQTKAATGIALEGKRIEAEPVPTLENSQEITQDSWRISFPQTRICTLEELIEHCKVDLNKWTVKSFKVNKWEVGTKNEDRTVKVTPLFQVYALLVPNIGKINLLAEIDELKESARKWAPKPKPITRTQVKPCAGHLLEMSLRDMHFGKLAWHGETGWADYDTQLATDAWHGAVDTFLQRAAPFTLERILLPIGDDLLQVDNPANTTTSGTQVDVDSRFKKTYRTVRALLCETIERLREVAPVDVVMVSGNHDRFSNFTLGDSLECWFRNFKDVSIDNRPLRRKYYQYGRTLLALTHGDGIKHADLYSLMPAEAPVEFASTTWREWHLGHLHKEALAEKHGIRARVLPSLCAADEWHAGNGFVGNMRMAEAFIWHPTDCLVSQSFYYIPELRPGQQALMDMKKK